MFMRHSWSTTNPLDLKSHTSCQIELMLEGNCLLSGTLVVVLAKLYQRILQDLYRGHGGVVRMKLVVRSYLRCLRMDQD